MLEGRLAQIANLLGDMPGEPFLVSPPKPKKIFPTLTEEEANRIWTVFPEAREQFLHLLRGRRLEGKIPEDVLEEIQYEGAAKAVRAARDRLTPAFMSTAMKFELGRYWRSDQGKGHIEQLGDDPEDFSEALEGGEGQEDSVRGWSTRSRDLVQQPPQPVVAARPERDWRLFIRQPGVTGPFRCTRRSEENCTLILAGSIGSQVDGAFGGRNRILARIGKSGIPTKKERIRSARQRRPAAFAFLKPKASARETSPKKHDLFGNCGGVKASSPPAQVMCAGGLDQPISSEPVSVASAWASAQARPRADNRWSAVLSTHSIAAVDSDRWFGQSSLDSRLPR
jgi:hypothetical protein